MPAKRRSSEMPEAGGGAAKRVDTGMLAGALDRDSPADIEFARNWVPQDLQVVRQLSFFSTACRPCLTLSVWQCARLR